MGIACTAPDTDFWFPGASTARDRQDYVHLTNPDDPAAVVDLKMYGPNGALKSAAGEAITVPARSSVPVLLSTLTDQRTTDVSAACDARSGRVGAAVQAADDEARRRLAARRRRPAAQPSCCPASRRTPPSVRLVAFAPGRRRRRPEGAARRARRPDHPGRTRDAARQERHDRRRRPRRRHQGRARLAGADPGRRQHCRPRWSPALRVTRGKGDKQETAFIPATAPIERAPPPPTTAPRAPSSP